MGLIFVVLVIAVFVVSVVYGMFWSAQQRRRALEAAVEEMRDDLRNRRDREAG